MMDAVQKAKCVSEKETVEIREKLLRRNGKVYKLSLYTIYWASNNYYLIGSHDNYDGLTHYRLDRMMNLEMPDEVAIAAKEKVGENPEIYIQKYIEESVNHFSRELVRIEVQYRPDSVTNAILYDFAEKDVKVDKQADDICKATFVKMDSVALVGWFLQYANRFKVLAPDSLQNAIITELADAPEKYHL